MPVNGGGGVSLGPAVCYGPGAISMKENWVQGAPLHLHTQLHTPLNPIPWRRLRIALYNRLCARSIVTRRRGMGYKTPLWGKGLNDFRCCKHVRLAYFLSGDILISSIMV